MDRTALVTLLAPVVAPLGLEIDRIDVRAGQRQVVRVALDGDGPSGTGPDLDQIAAATKAISLTLDQADMGPQAYVLEVSTRGVGAPLTTASQYRRNIGRLVALTWRDVPLQGRITAVGDDDVEITTEDGARRLPLAEIKRAVVQVEFRREEQ